MNIKYYFSEKYARYCRLEGTLQSYKMELEKRLKDNPKKDTTWVDEIREMLDQAEHYMMEQKLDQAWRSLHAAQRMEIHGMNKEERVVQAKILYHEISKIKNWRKEAIKLLIGKPDDSNYVAPTAEELVQAILVKDEHYDNEYYKNRLARVIYSVLFVMLAAIALIIILFIGSGEYMNDRTNLSTFLGVILFGLLGAVTSAILFTRTQSELSRITEINTNRFLIFSRILVAVGLVIFIYVLINSSILEQIKLFNFSVDILDNYDFFTIAFVSGFTERLAMRGIDLIAGGKKGEKEE
jgi:uncharacterized short protein YbdD (DUF466 family)